MSKALQEAQQLIAELERRTREYKIKTFFPETGPYRRELYPKHMDFFRAGNQHRQRAFIAANRVGKTVVGGCEAVFHATGLYPDWWEGKRFDEPTHGWVAGVSNEATRDVLQNELLGLPGSADHQGTGLIPKELIVDTTSRPGVPNAVQDIHVRHASGGISTIGFKAYAQGRDTFQGTAKHWIWLDEEPPSDIFNECLIRTATTKGIIFGTFTPLSGLSDVVLRFMPGGKAPEHGYVEDDPAKYVVSCTWEDVPHISDEDKQDLLSGMSPHERDARSRGIPALGSGAIYPISEEDYVVEPFEIPAWWPRCYGLDVGWNKTAAVWLAVDPQTQEIYAYSEHYMGKAEPVIHVHSIASRGAWIPGAVDPAANGRSQVDGTKLIEVYSELGLDLLEADNTVEAGIYTVWQAFASGRLKVFSSCTNLITEIRVYRRDDSGRVVKKNDHACDALRYGVVTGLNLAIPVPEEDNNSSSRSADYDRNSFTGY